MYSGMLSAAAEKCQSEFGERQRQMLGPSYIYCEHRHFHWKRYDICGKLLRIE